MDRFAMVVAAVLFAACGSVPCEPEPDPSSVLALERLSGDCGALAPWVPEVCASRGDPDVCGVQWDCYGLALEDGREIVGGNVIGRVDALEGGGWISEAWVGGELEDGSRCEGVYLISGR